MLHSFLEYEPPPLQLLVPLSLLLLVSFLTHRFPDGTLVERRIPNHILLAWLLNY